MDRPVDITTVSDSIPQFLPAAQRGVCEYCGCTDTRGCTPACFWIDDDHTVCSAPPCVGRHFGRFASQVQRLVKLIQAGGA
jgi:hypothetical protein